MSVANLYASVEALAGRVPAHFGDGEGGVDETKRDAAESLLEAISRAIDSATRREPGAFSPSPEEPTERTIYGNNETCLKLPEHVAGSIPVDGVTTITGLTAPHFVEYRSMLCITDEHGLMLRGEEWRDGVPYRIMARWGYAETPADIREACLIWASVRARLNAGDVSGIVTTITRDGSTLQRDDIPPIVRDMLKPHVLVETEAEDSGRVETGNLVNTDFNPNHF